jgi:outer membrane protein assembly factor BamB
MRRRFLQVVGVLAAVVGLSGCWLQPGFDGNHSAFNSLETTITSANVSGLHLAWTAQLTGSVADPAVSGQGVYAATSDPSAGGALTLLDRGTGSTEWSASLFSALFPEASAGGPTVAGDRVYVPSPIGLAVAPGSIEVVDAATGAADPSIPLGVNSLVSSGNSFAGTSFICASGGLPCETALDVLGANGTVNWSTGLSLGSGGSTPAATSPAVGSQAIFLGSGDSVERFPLAPPAGYPSSCTSPGPGFCTPTWSTSLGGTGLGPIAGPVLSPDGNTVFAVDGSTVSAIDANTGAVQWTGTLSATVSSSPALAGSSLYVPLSNGQLEVFASGGCGQATCAPQWAGNIGTSSITHQPAVVAGGVVFTASADGSLHALPAAGCGKAMCKPLLSVQTGSQITGGPVVAFGQLYVGTNDGKVLAYGL